MGMLYTSPVHVPVHSTVLLTLPGCTAVSSVQYKKYDKYDEKYGYDKKYDDKYEVSVPENREYRSAVKVTSYPPLPTPHTKCCCQHLSGGLRGTAAEAASVLLMWALGGVVGGRGQRGNLQRWCFASVCRGWMFLVSCLRS
jgi:hypothetical protein